MWSLVNYDLILLTDNKLFVTVAELRHETLQLTIQNEKIRQESLQAVHGSSSDAKSVEKSSVKSLVCYAAIFLFSKTGFTGY